MLIFADWAQRILTLRHVDAELLAGTPWPFQFHIILGMTIFLLLPFSRLVHVWSGFAAVGYLFRPYQVVRGRRLNVPAGRNLPGQPSASEGPPAKSGPSTYDPLKPAAPEALTRTRLKDAA